jgi:HAD superfamily hydrolase (TIGR01509 family)
MDGTLTLPGSIDFAAMRARVGAPPGIDVLEFIESQPDEETRARLHGFIEDEEEAGFRRQELMPDAGTVLDTLGALALRLGVITRNCEGVMKRTLALPGLRPGAFSITLSRSFTPSKPHPAPVLHVADRWGCSVGELVFVGDSLDDVLSGRAAGARTVLVGTPGLHGHDTAAPHADAVVRTLSDVLSVLQAWDPGLALIPGAAATAASADTE